MYFMRLNRYTVSTGPCMNTRHASLANDALACQNKPSLSEQALGLCKHVYVYMYVHVHVVVLLFTFQTHCTVLVRVFTVL